jgi:hypothetical protein
VDGKDYTCSDSAKQATTGGKQIDYVIGEVHTPCDVMAAVELAKARIGAADKALANATGAKTASGTEPKQG